MAHIFKILKFIINPLTSPGEMVTVFTCPYLSAGAPAQGEAKGLMSLYNQLSEIFVISFI